MTYRCIICPYNVVWFVSKSVKQICVESLFSECGCYSMILILKVQNDLCSSGVSGSTITPPCRTWTLRSGGCSAPSMSCVCPTAQWWCSPRITVRTFSIRFLAQILTCFFVLFCKRKSSNGSYHCTVFRKIVLQLASRELTAL